MTSDGVWEDADCWVVWPPQEPPPSELSAAPLDEEGYGAWAPGQYRPAHLAALDEAIGHACNPPKFIGGDPGIIWDAAPSGLGFDCCEMARSVNRCRVRYQWLLGECADCGATVFTAQPQGWAGPVRNSTPDDELADWYR